MSATRATWLRNVCYTNDTRVTRVKNLDFDNDTSGNIFSHQFISYIANERLQGEGNFILRTTFWKCLVPMPECVPKVSYKN